MKKLITTVFFALLLLLVIPPALESPVRSLLSALGAPAEHSRAIALALTGLGIFLFLDRKRIRARRQRRRERRAERRERERLRSSYVLNLSPYEYEEYVAEELRQEGFTEVDTTAKSGDFGADVLARDICIRPASLRKPPWRWQTSSASCWCARRSDSLFVDRDRRTCYSVSLQCRN